VPKKILRGVVVSKKTDQTVSVKVVMRYSHGKIGKTVSQFKKYAAHDPENRCKEGEEVRIIESRPISKTKRWQVIYA